MLKKLLNGQSKTITSAAILLGMATLASKLLGFLRLRLMTAVFGVGKIADAYTAASKVPEFVFDLLVLGAIASSFIPIFLSFMENNKEREGWEFVNNILNLLVVFTAALSIICAIFAPFITRLIAPGFIGDASQMSQTVLLMRILFITPAIFGASSVMGGILRSFRRFLIYAIAPLLYNIGIIIGIIFFSKFWGIMGTAVGAVLGSIMHLSIQFLGALSSGFRYKMSFKYGPGVKRLSKLMIPHIMGIAANQINVLIFVFIASRLASGDVFLFNSVEMIHRLPIGIFAISLSIAAFPTLASFGAKKEWDNFIETFSATASQALFWIIPSSAIIYALRIQIVRVILGSKGVSWATTISAGQTLGYLCAGMFAAGLLPLLARTFYSLQDTITPFLTGLLSSLISVAAGFYLAQKMGVSGLGLAFSAASIANIAILLIILKKRAGRLGAKKISLMLAKIVPASAVMILSIQAAKYLIASKVNMQTFLGIALQGSIAGLIGIIIYCIICLILKCEEMKIFIDALWRRIRFRKPVQVREISDEIDE